MVESSALSGKLPSLAIAGVYIHVHVNQLLVNPVIVLHHSSKMCHDIASYKVL